MKQCKLIIKDSVNASFQELDPVIRRSIVEATKFLIPYARHTPSYKLGRWDGTVSFATVGGGTFINMLDKVLPIVIDAGYDIELVDQRVKHEFDFPVIDEHYFGQQTWPEGHTLAGQPIVLRDYQVAAVNTFLSSPQSLQEISTAAGKTIVTATLSHICEPYGRTIVIVPSKSLVEQTEEDYRNVGLDTGVYYGNRKELGHKHTICTWQSLAILEKRSKAQRAVFPITEFLKDVVCVIIDECHSAKAMSLKTLLSGAFATVPIRWGLTGTIPKEEFEYFTLLCTIGPIIGQVRAKELQDAGHLANCHVNIIQLRDDHVAFSDYNDENKWLTTDTDRIAWIANYIEKLVEDTGNTLVLVSRIDTGKKLAALIPGAAFIHGETKTKNRKEKYDEIQINDEKCLIATSGIAAVGINIPRLFNLVLFEPGKSFVRTLQSIGRVLRKASDKDYANIYDLCSTLKFSKRHLTKRKSYYKDAEYPTSTRKVDYR